MDYRVLTVARELGSGGAAIAKRLAKQLGWKLLDRELIEEIACAAQVDAAEVSRHDECIESLRSRINKTAVRASTALAIGVITRDAFDDKRMTELTRQIVEHAYASCHCVIVGRGAQCILQSKPDVFHVFVYAPLEDRIRNLRERLGPNVDLERRIRAVEAGRAHYLKQRFGEDWRDPHLYNLMVSSHEGEEACARVILNAMSGGSGESRLAAQDVKGSAGRL